MKKTYQVIGMSCVICKANVERCLNNLEYVNSAIVSLMDNEVLIDYDETKISFKELFKAVKDEGYELVNITNNKVSFSFIKLLISIVLTIILMSISMLNMDNPINTIYTQAILAFIIIFLNIKFYQSGFKTLFRLKPNMDSLVSLSSLISYIYSIYASSKILNMNNSYHLYFETSAMVLTIVSLGKYIEDKNKKKTTKFIRGLSTLIPMQANLYKDNIITIIPIEQVKKGDHLLIKQGESIPQDGIIIKGITNIDESLITGEANYVNKTINDQVIGGTVNIDGEIIIEVNKISNQTTLSKIVSLTKKATMSKLPIERLTDKIANYFVFAVIAISIITFVVWYFSSNNLELSLNFSLSVLVISCPCALGLATPAAIASSCSNANANGILIKNPVVLEIAHKIKNIVLDKTGTITNNKLDIIKTIKYDEQFERVIASIEANSNHPIANTIKQVYTDSSIAFDSIQIIESKGIKATLNDDIYLAGNYDLISSQNINLDKENQFAIENECSMIAVSKNTKLLGVIYLKDQIRQTSFKAIANLLDKKINVVIASGDKENIVKKVAEELNITRYYGSIKPTDKQNIINELKKDGITCMVGDGINDAASLSSADISISLASSVDIANESSDISLLNDDLNDINYLIKLSKFTMKIITENLFWALFYNSLFIPLAAGLFYNKYQLMLNPMMGSLAMSMSSIVVIINALRIVKLKKEK